MICEKCGIEYEGENCPACEEVAEVAEETCTCEEIEETPAKKSGVFGIIGLISGIITLVTCFLFRNFGLFQFAGKVTWLTVLIFSSIEKKRNPASKAAKTGFALSLISLIIRIIRKVFSFILSLIMLVIVIALLVISVLLPTANIA